MPDIGTGTAPPTTPLQAWLGVSRLPFLTVSLIPFILGLILAVAEGHTADPLVMVVSTLTVAAIHLSAHYFGEYYDLAGDAMNRSFNRFSGGSRVLVKGLLEPERVRLAGIVACGAAALLGLALLLHPRVGPWALPLGLLGVAAGAGYSLTPFRWAYRGLGEVIIGLSFGWLTVNTGFYLLAGSLSAGAMLVSVPVGLSVFNIILINEFPDLEADRAVGKANLVVRAGPEVMARVYVVAAVVTFLLLLVTPWALGRSPPAQLAVLPAASLALANARSAGRGDWRLPGPLEALAGRTILASLLGSIGLALGLGLL